MENLPLLIAVLIVLEFFEGFIQHAATLYGVMERLYRWYAKSIFLFFLLHPTLYFSLFVALYTDILNLYMVLLLTVKVMDLFYKIDLIERLFVERSVPPAWVGLLEWKIPPWFFLTGVFVYPPILYYAIVSG